MNEEQNSVFQNWSDYWAAFNAFTATFKKTNRESISNDLRKAQLHVNGLTDGWFEFLQIFERTISNNRQRMSEMEIQSATQLVNYVKASLLTR